MNKQYATKSWIFAGSVTTALLFLLSLNGSAQAAQDNEISTSDKPITAAPMQLARGGNFLVPSPRRTQNDKNVPSQAAPEQTKDADKASPGLQGPKGKTPEAEGQDGIQKTQTTDMNKS
jgi:hypothetical protein